LLQSNLFFSGESARIFTQESNSIAGLSYELEASVFAREATKESNIARVEAPHSKSMSTIEVEMSGVGKRKTETAEQFDRLTSPFRTTTEAL